MLNNQFSRTQKYRELKHKSRTILYVDYRAKDDMANIEN